MTIQNNHKTFVLNIKYTTTNTDNNVIALEMSLKLKHFHKSMYINRNNYEIIIFHVTLTFVDFDGQLTNKLCVNKKVSFSHLHKIVKSSVFLFLAVDSTTFCVTRGLITTFNVTLKIHIYFP